jgi:hypothetical protein
MRSRFARLTFDSWVSAAVCASVVVAAALGACSSELGDGAEASGSALSSTAPSPAAIGSWYFQNPGLRMCQALASGQGVQCQCKEDGVQYSDASCKAPTGWQLLPAFCSAFYATDCDKCESLCQNAYSCPGPVNQCVPAYAVGWKP